MIPPDAVLLRLYLNASHRWQGKPLYRAVVEAARALPVAGASVFLVDLSYGSHRRLRDAKSEYIFVDIPVVIEVVDASDRIDALVAELNTKVGDGLTTAEAVRVIRYTHHENGPGPAHVESSQTVGTTTDHQSAGEHPMPIEGVAQRLTVYIGSSDTWHGHNLAMAIVERCRKTGLAGATASLGVMGFGKHSRMHRARLFGLSEDLPEKIEIVDRPDRIAQILPILEEMVDGGLIVLQDVRVVRYAGHSTSA
jgi:PII-like signaling protein